MTMIFKMRANPGHGLLPGKCAKCEKPVYEADATLSDAYNVWAGECPHCGALNFLALTGLRGYSSAGMDLVLPTEEERIANNLPEGTPTSGRSGRPADLHGSVAGEIYHKLGA
jgi:hypothetical protein